MHQTTVRFGPDLWEAIEIECSRLGVSAAQFVREATLARLSYTAGRRGELEYERALLAVGAPSGTRRAAERERAEARARGTADAAVEAGSDASAVIAQSDLVRTRSMTIRAESERLREAHREFQWRTRQ